MKQGQKLDIRHLVYLLLLVLTAAGMSFGCSKRIQLKGQNSTETWVCEDAADEAIKQGDYHTAVSLHKTILQNSPDNALALYHLGYTYGQMGDHQKEVSYYEKAMALGFSGNNIYFNAGMAYGELNDIERSIHAFKKALQIKPDSADNHFGLAMAYYRSNLDDRIAEKEFLEAIRIDPGHLDARLYLSLLYTDMGQLKMAAAQLRKILELDPINERALMFLEAIEKE